MIKTKYNNYTIARKMVVNEGVSIVHACKKSNISRISYYRWFHKERKAGTLKDLRPTLNNFNSRSILIILIDLFGTFAYPQYAVIIFLFTLILITISASVEVVNP